MISWLEFLMIAFTVVVFNELGDERLNCRSPIGMMQFKHSSLIDPTNRSA